MSSDPAKPRLQEVDALRGIAALVVVLFHFSTRMLELYPELASPSLRVPWGHYGVNLFFIISGFVIFMTLERVRQPMDFVVSRFSRLFPAYWLCLWLTFAVTHLLGLPGKTVGVTDALINMSMLHGLARVPHVDGVYWTLEVELLFYVGMWSLYRIGWLGRLHWALAGLLAARLAWFLAPRLLGVDFSWTLSRLLILPYIPWFTLGIAVYLGLPARAAAQRRRALPLALAALASLAVEDSPWLALLAASLALTVWLAASGRLAPLRHPVLVWLGTISYPLYLLHENIGWAVMRQLQGLGLHADLAWALTLAGVLALAHAVTRWVEQPAMRWLRQRYQGRLAAARA